MIRGDHNWKYLVLSAEELGIKELVPAYSDPALHPGDLLTGVSFASGGSGFDPLTPKIAVVPNNLYFKLLINFLIHFLTNWFFEQKYQSVLSLSDQLGMFKEYVGKLKAMVGEERKNTILGKGIFLVVAGSDDIANSYFDIGVRKRQYDVPAYTDIMLSSASSFLKVQF